MSQDVPAALHRPIYRSTTATTETSVSASPGGAQSTTAPWPFERRLHWVLRVAVAMCFVGHGAFGILTKAEWLPYFAAVGIPSDWALALMPVVGVVDIAVGIATLVSPRPAILLYMALWALWTALLRPLSGETPWETLERAGNYGAPLAFLLVAGPYGTLREWLTRGEWRDWGARADARPVRPATALHVARILTWTTGLLLIGHGALGALEAKPLLARLWGAAGAGPWAVATAGWLEIALGAAVLVRPALPLLVFIVGWKVATELLFPLAGAPVWEFIERGGSYAAPVALALVLVHIDRNILKKRGDA